MPTPVEPAFFHILTKPTGAICNLNCAYCFFLTKEHLYPGSSFRMSDEVLENYLRQLIESQPGQEAIVSWQGGEPTLMGLDFYRRSIEVESKYRRPGFRIQHTIQTNGILVDAEWCEFLRENDFLVGLSLDGPRELHDAFRVDKGGHPTFDKVVRAARLMQREGVEFNVLTSVHAANGDRPRDVYRFLRDEIGAAYIQLIPIVERINDQGQVGLQQGTRVSDRSVKPEQWGNFLIGVFEEWVRRDVGKVYVQMFDAALGSWVGVPAGMCIFAETCGDALALEHNGDLYSCDHFVEPAYLLGNIQQIPLTDMVASPQQRKFGWDKLRTLPRYCRECDVRFACHGECPKNRFALTPDREPGLNYLCAGYKAFFHHVDWPMRIMAELLRRDRAPAEIMRWYGTEDAKRGVTPASAGANDPCPCGSGKTFEKCHGKARFGEGEAAGA